MFLERTLNSTNVQLFDIIKRERGDIVRYRLMGKRGDEGVKNMLLEITLVGNRG